jgi:hypothetical protein
MESESVLKGKNVQSSRKVWPALLFGGAGPDSGGRGARPLRGRHRSRSSPSLFGRQSPPQPRPASHHGRRVEPRMCAIRTNAGHGPIVRRVCQSPSRRPSEAASSGFSRWVREPVPPDVGGEGSEIWRGFGVVSGGVGFEPTGRGQRFAQTGSRRRAILAWWPGRNVRDTCCPRRVGQPRVQSRRTRRPRDETPADVADLPASVRKRGRSVGGEVVVGTYDSPSAGRPSSDRGDVAIAFVGAQPAASLAPRNGRVAFVVGGVPEQRAIRTVLRTMTEQPRGPLKDASSRS